MDPVSADKGHFPHSIPDLKLEGSTGFTHIPLKPPSARASVSNTVGMRAQSSSPAKRSPKKGLLRSPEAGAPSVVSGAHNIRGGHQGGSTTATGIVDAGMGSSGVGTVLNPKGTMLRVNPIRPPSEKERQKRGAVGETSVIRGERRRPVTAGLCAGNQVGTKEKRQPEKKKVWSLKQNHGAFLSLRQQTHAPKSTVTHRSHTSV